MFTGSPPMTRRDSLKVLGTAALGIACASNVLAADADTHVYELRVYTISPGKADALHNRFRTATLRLFKKHGVESVGYWMPVDENDQRLHFLLRYPSREAREESWKNFMGDPDWQAAYKASEANGAILAKPPENWFVQMTDFSPEVKIGADAGERVFEMRTYTTPPGLLPNIDARFRDHTIRLFEKHGMTNFAYWHRMKDQKDAEVTLQYMLAHKSKEAAGVSFKAFGGDPDWNAAKKASEEKAGGSLTIKDGVKSVYLKATDYSPTK